MFQARLSVKVMLTDFLRCERTHHYWFPWKKLQMWTVLPIANSLGKIHLNWMPPTHTQVCVCVCVCIYVLWGVASRTYGHLPPITKTIQVRRTRHCWRSRDELISDVLLWTPTYGRAKAGWPAQTYVQQLCEDTGCSPEDLPEAMNDGSGERGSGISMLAAWHDDDI